jgi:MFS family permease
MSKPLKSPFDVKNVKLFILFRIFFNARFYYPVFTILFLDFGLTLSQFATLNAIWAATIVLSEVPSGALADIVGRRNLLVFAGILMTIEIALLCLVPLGKPTLIFSVFLLNRVLSGLAEAAASGADEALAYDSLKSAGMVQEWGRVLEWQIRSQSFAFMGSMVCGALVYDHVLIQWMVGRLGLEWTITPSLTLRLPLWLTLLMGCGTLLTSLAMVEDRPKTGLHRQRPTQWHLISSAFQMTLRAGQWILHTPAVLMCIITGLCFDHVIRMLITLNSQYYRLIALPEASFGLISSMLAGLGLIIPRLTRRCVDLYPPTVIFSVMAMVVFAGLVGVSLVWPYWGLLPVFLLIAVMYANGFLMSIFLNTLTPSDQRATVISFKGLSFNLAYGAIGLFYALLVNHLKTEPMVTASSSANASIENVAFTMSLQWFPWYFVIVFGTVALAYWFKRRAIKNSGP